MRILVYGAGVLGSLYAARLKEAGYDVSILARNQRLTDLREHGIVLEDVVTGRRTYTYIAVVEQMAPTDAYDLVVVLVRKDQLASVLPTLAANQHTPNILFMVNNAAGPSEIISALGAERVLMGFAGAGGVREGFVVRYAILPGWQQPTTFGELDGNSTPRLQQIVSAFKAAGFPVTISSNIDAWLKTHVAYISPIACAIHLAAGDNYRLASTRDGLVLVVRAIREGFRVLQSLKIPITPPLLKINQWLPEPLLIMVWKQVLNNKTAEFTMARSADATRPEMKELAKEFKQLIQTTAVPTPSLEHLYGYLDPAVSPIPIPAGSAEMKLDWLTLQIGLGVLAGLFAVLIKSRLKEAKADKGA